MIAYKYYEREVGQYAKNRWGNGYQTRFIRKCEKKSKLWYTIEWWAQREDGSWKKRRNKKYVSGVKFKRDLTHKDVEAIVFIDSL